jgi:NAD(P)H-quinone oxidoreductase subunit 5
MEALYDYAWLIPVFPLAGAMLVGLGLISLNKFTNGLRELNAVLIISLMGAAMAASFALLASQFQGHPTYIYAFEWASAGNFHLSMGYTIDHLTSS